MAVWRKRSAWETTELPQSSSIAERSWSPLGEPKERPGSNFSREGLETCDIHTEGTIPHLQCVQIGKPIGVLGSRSQT